MSECVVTTFASGMDSAPAAWILRPNDHESRKERAMWYDRWYKRRTFKRSASHVIRNRVVQIGSAIAAVLFYGLRRWRATRA